MREITGPEERQEDNEREDASESGATEDRETMVEYNEVRETELVNEYREMDEKKGNDEYNEYDQTMRFCSETDNVAVHMIKTVARQPHQW
eukprot:4096976-Amphidinium_carterae.1